MSVTTAYQCINAAAAIAKLVIEWRKVQEISNLKSSIERQNFISEVLASYSNIIKNDIESLMHIYFKSAFENLKYAIGASVENQKEYLLQARNRFIDATTIEKNQNLITAYIGLSLCQICLTDSANANRTLQKVIGVEANFSDDIDELIKEWEYGKKVIDIFSYVLCHSGGVNAVFLKRVRSASFNMEDEFSRNEEKLKNLICERFPEYSKIYWENRLNEFAYALYRVNIKMTICGFEMEPTSLLRAVKFAIREILYEDFVAFKQNVIREFHLQ